MASFTVVDDADDTGFTATIAGGAGGDSHSLAAYTFTGGVGGLTLAGTFTRTGNGALALVLTAGAYLLVLTTNAAVTEAPQFAIATSADQSNQEDLLDLVLAKLQSLSLPGLSAADMDSGKHPLPSTLTEEKGVLLSNVAEVFTRKYNSHDDVTYGFLVTCYIKNSQQNNTANQSAHLTWRQTIIKAFNPTPTKVPIVHPLLVSITVEPAAPWIFNPEAFLKHNLDAASLVIRITLREPR